MNTALRELDAGTAFLVELGAQGLSLSPRPGGRIEVRPASRLDDETAARIREMREPLLKALSRSTWPCIRCERFAFPGPRMCYWCEQAEVMGVEA